MPKGKYKVYDNEIFFNPIEVKPTSVDLKAKKYCYIVETSGSLFGHDYSYTIEYCVSFSWGERSVSVISIEPKLSPEQLFTLSNKYNNEIELFEDVVIKDGEMNYTVKAGKYFINNDGKAYIQDIVRK